MDGERYQTSLCETLEGLCAVTFFMFFFAGVVALVHSAFQLITQSSCKTAGGESE